MSQIRIREECRRDGIAASFLIDAPSMVNLAEAFPNSIISVGYPSICSEEEKRVKEILEAFKDLPIESAVYSHAIKDQIDLSGRLIEGYKNASACFWIPTSDFFISQTLKGSTAKDVLNKATNLVKHFVKEYKKPIDVALTDTTCPESGLEERLAEFSNELSQAGARQLVVCDSRGIGINEIIKKNFECIRKRYSGPLEFHPHNDNGKALEHIKIALDYDTEIINTAMFGSSERGTLISPEELLKANYNICSDKDKLDLFKIKFSEKIGEPPKVIKEVYGPSTIVTGSQYRLRGRSHDEKLIFGITSDRFIFKKMTDSNLDDETIRKKMEELKNKLYTTGKLYYTREDLSRLI